MCVAAVGFPYAAVCADSPSDETNLPPLTPAADDATSQMLQAPGCPGPGPQCGQDMGQSWQQQQPGMCKDGPGGQGPKGHMMGPDGRMGGGHGPDIAIPDELKARMDTLRVSRDLLRDLWVKAVLARGDKPVSQVRDEFQKTNAALIDDIRKRGEAIREDMRALREGYAGARGGNREERAGGTDAFPGKGPEGMMSGHDPAFGFDGSIKAEIDADMVARLKALKEPLTAESFAKLQKEAFEAHRGEVEAAIDKARSARFEDGPEGMPPMMAPGLARMRDAMGHMRGASMEERRELRAQLREAMKLQDPVKREAAIRKILDDIPPSPAGQPQDGAKAPADDAKSPVGK
jgi:hypothetical protein